MMSHDESNASPAPTRTATSGARMSRSTFLPADAVPGGPPATFQSCDSGIWPPSLSSAAHALIRYEASNWNAFCKCFAASMYCDSERACSGETRSTAPSTATLVFSRAKLSVLRAWSASDLQSSRSASATGRLSSVISGSAAASATFRDWPRAASLLALPSLCCSSLSCSFLHDICEHEEATSDWMDVEEGVHGYGATAQRHQCMQMEVQSGAASACMGGRGGGGAHLVLQLVNASLLCNDLSKVVYRPALS